jgi:hypothetical protein
MERARTMGRMEPLHPPIVPPDGAVPAGVTPQGKQLYTLKTKRSKSMPKLDAKGKQEYRRHMITGENLYPLRVAEPYVHEELFYLESEGNGNVHKVAWRWPTEEELAHEDRERRIKEVQRTLPEVLVDKGLTADDLLAMLSKKQDDASVAIEKDLEEVEEGDVVTVTTRRTAGKRSK